MLSLNLQFSCNLNFIAKWLLNFSQKTYMKNMWICLKRILGGIEPRINQFGKEEERVSAIG